MCSSKKSSPPPQIVEKPVEKPAPIQPPPIPVIAAELDPGEDLSPEAEAKQKKRLGKKSLQISVAGAGGDSGLAIPKA